MQNMSFSNCVLISNHYIPRNVLGITSLLNQSIIRSYKYVDKTLKKKKIMAQNF